MDQILKDRLVLYHVIFPTGQVGFQSIKTLAVTNISNEYGKHICKCKRVYVGVPGTYHAPIVVVLEKAATLCTHEMLVDIMQCERILIARKPVARSAPVMVIHIMPCPFIMVIQRPGMWEYPFAAAAPGMAAESRQCCPSTCHIVGQLAAHSNFKNDFKLKVSMDIKFSGFLTTTLAAKIPAQSFERVA
ncbi:predicted protein [Histoplasma capsulatum H143]|uniref:Uncharacterized protein n=1 Tax=Ajellomyces capsulatus (strain H143) TaxID=544712 RepID=C6HGU5_AJECH|nr:predicted protein [Histoplasma capsulatum H143]